VCASAGHNLEALLAAHGSGAVARSRTGGPVLNIDVGGGTTKLALAENGRVIGTLAVSAGSRLVELDDSGRLVRIEHGAAELAAELGLTLRLGEHLSDATKQALALGLAQRIVDSARGRAPESIRLAGDLPATPAASSIVISGGVGELMGAATTASFGDLGQELARALAARAGELPAPIAQGTERIRATVIGASQFSVQLSGNTVHVSDESGLPLHNVPVVSIDLSRGSVEERAVERAIARGAERLDLGASEGPIAVAVAWDGDPLYATLRALAGGIAAAHRGAARRGSTMIVALTADVGASLGHILADELGATEGVIAIDGLELADLDYIDIGERILPANVVPVVVKSLVFPETSGPLRPQILTEVR
jgi:ethanolamine utilization protein EutA